VICLLIFFYLFFIVSWPYPKVFTHQALAERAAQPVELFLWLDPLVGLSTALAARSWNVAVIGTLIILVMSLVFPRFFCGYLCPLGASIDGGDYVVRHLCGQRRAPPGQWLNVRFYILAIVLGAALAGVVLAGFVAAIPVFTRGLAFTAGNLQLGWLKNWGMVPPMTWAIWFSIVLFAAVFLVSLKTPRFWCRYLCPTGALLSLPALANLSWRTVNGQLCTRCGKCRAACPFDAINEDFSTKPLSCSFCQTCGGACPVGAIGFFIGPNTGPVDNRRTLPLSRRAALAATVAGAAAAFGGRAMAAGRHLPIRPPGSVDEAHFLDLCIRCEQCLKVCPGPVLQAAGLEYGWESFWTPVAVFTHAGCHQECHFCTQICPTGAIQVLALTQKRQARMGLAVIDPQLCLPHKGARDCQLCYDECTAAGYHAIVMRAIKLDSGKIPEGTFSPEEIEAMGRINAPVVLADACVGCGLCEYRCHAVCYRQKQWLPRRAIVVTPIPAAG
jgi:ferredoxin